MTEDELARAVAAEFGADVEAAVAQEPSTEATRAFGVTEALMIAGLIGQAVQIALQFRAMRQSEPQALAYDLVTSPQLSAAAVSPGLPEEKRLDVMGQTLSKLAPDTFGAYKPGNGEPTASDKRSWISSYIKSRGEDPQPSTRSFVGGPPLLVPFADQDYWALHQPIGWIPDASDGPGVVRVDVPKGFVTDLASIPSYLWPIMTKTGRYGNAAIYHDWLYVEQPCDRATADLVFDRALKDMGVDDATRQIMWAAVRIFGGAGWKNHAQDKIEGRKWVIAKFPDDPRITWAEWRQRPDVFA